MTMEMVRTRTIIKEHWDQWLAALRSGEFAQAKDKLSNRDEPGQPMGFCCLGVGCKVARIEVTPVYAAGEEGPQNEYDWVASFRFARHDTLAPPEFFEWLGLTREDWHHSNDGDLTLDVSNPMVFQDDNFGDVTAASLNDWGFTFPQIADMLDHFGVRINGEPVKFA